MERRFVSEFSLGDVIFDEEDPTVLGLVTEVHDRSITVVFEHGARAGGPGLIPIIRHQEPRLQLPLSDGVHGSSSWERGQAVAAILRDAGLR